MSIASSSIAFPHNQMQNYFQQRHADLRQLGQDLKAGDLSGAEQEFSAIQKLAQNGPLATGGVFAHVNREQDFNAIGEALQTGDLASAQEALSALQSTFRHTKLDPPPVVAEGWRLPKSIEGSEGSSLNVVA